MMTPKEEKIRMIMFMFFAVNRGFSVHQSMRVPFANLVLSNL